MNSRERVLTALAHQEPDRVPVDFLATPEVWKKLVDHFQTSKAQIDSGGFFSPEREAVLRQLQVDCRLISYDMFCSPPEGFLKPGARVDWESSLARSTPNRMWRQVLPDGTYMDIWGHHTRVVENPTGCYEEFASFPLESAESVNDLRSYPWPDPDWWETSAVSAALDKIDPDQELHVRIRSGSIFESAWQLRGMERFMMDLALDPAIPEYILDRITEILVEVTRRLLDAAGDRVFMVYFYDDVGAQDKLLISKRMWERFLRPRHKQIVDLAHSYGKSVMYHCDGAIYTLLEDLIDLGIDVLNPVQPTARDMAPERLKSEFGDRLSFHGGIDIVDLLPKGTPDEVRADVRQRVKVMGKGGGYIMCSSHHIQPDTPVENILAMYELGLR